MLFCVCFFALSPIACTYRNAVTQRRHQPAAVMQFSPLPSKKHQLSYTSVFSFSAACFRHSIRSGLKQPHSPFSIILKAFSTESSGL